MSHDWRISTVYDEGVSFEVDLQEMFAAADRIGVPKPPTLCEFFESYPHWVLVSFAVAGEEGLRWAFGVTDRTRDEFRAAMRAAVALGGMDAARQASRAFIKVAA